MQIYREDKNSIFKGEDRFDFDRVNNGEDAIISFEEETDELIQNLKKEVKEYTIKYLGDNKYIQVYQGRKRIEWSNIPDDRLRYSPDYGNQVWSGWVTFTDGTWIERHEYDGSEWWEYKETPSLENVKED